MSPTALRSGLRLTAPSANSAYIETPQRMAESSIWVPARDALQRGADRSVPLASAFHRRGTDPRR